MSLVGNLEDLGLGDIFQIIFLSRRSGVLSIRGEVTEGKLYFRDGMIIAAQSNIISNNIQNMVFNLFIEEGNFDFELKDATEEIRSMKTGSVLISESGLNPQFMAMEGSRLLDEARRDKTAKPLMETQTHIKPIQKIEEEILSQHVEEGFSPRSIWTEAGIIEEDYIEPVVSSPGLSLLKSMAFELQNPHSSSEITLLILRFASEIMNRAVLFIVKRDMIEGWGQFGVIIKEGDPNRRIREIKIPPNDESIFKEVILKKMTIKKKDLEHTQTHEYLFKKLGGYWPVEIFIAPLMINGRVAALLYGDNAPEDKPVGETESLEIFLGQAGIAMERALLQKRLNMMKKE